MSFLKKFFKWILITFFGSVLLVYLALSIFLTIEERRGQRKFSPGDPVYFESSNPQKIEVLDSGIESLKRRIELIRNASESIDLEFFIYNVDRSARLITQELIKKADQGIKVRILVDFSIAVLQLKPVYAHFLKSHGVEVKYYNTSPLYRILSVQHRSHRKMLIIDDKISLTGGRNIADEYFDLSEDYNFLDSDIVIEGDIASEMRKSFDFYWNSDFSVSPEEMDFTVESKDLKKVSKFIEETSDLEEIYQKVDIIDLGSEVYTCTDSVFVTDYPGVGSSQRKVFEEIVSELSKTENKVVAESPYFILGPGGLDVVSDLGKRGIDLKVLTNSLYSTDAYYTVSHLYPRMGKIAKTGLDLLVYNGKPLSPKDKGRWGIHSKRAVLDEKIVLLGTYNIDPRSANLNSELMYVCRDSDDFAKAIQLSIEERMKKSRVLMSDNKPNSRSVLTEDATFSQRFWFFVTMPIANLFSFLL